MTAYGKIRGHEVYYDDCWRFLDTHEPVDHRRPCFDCNMPPTPEGYDYCLGRLPGLSGACCGHGTVEDASVRFNDGRDLWGQSAILKQQELKGL